MKVIGIDPGAKTGIAIYRNGLLRELATLPPEQIEVWVLHVNPALVVYEDSRRQSAVFSRGTNHRAALKIARNVGEIDQICRSIERLCEVLGIECVGVSPREKGAKLNAAQFRHLTGWTRRSNEHQRDAGVVAWRFRHVRRASADAALV